MNVPQQPPDLSVISTRDLLGIVEARLLNQWDEKKTFHLVFVMSHVRDAIKYWDEGVEKEKKNVRR